MQTPANASTLLRLTLTAALLALSPIAIHAQAPDPTLDQSLRDFVGDPADVRSLLASLQAGARTHNAPAVAALIHFPLRTYAGGRHTTIPNARVFLERYDRIMTPNVVTAIEHQRFADLFVRDQGAMIGDGQVWIGGICPAHGPRANPCPHPEVRIVTIQQTGTTPAAKPQ